MRPRTGHAIPTGWIGISGGRSGATEGYAREELVAELDSAFLSADLGLTPEVWDDHSAYIESWLEVLQKVTVY